MAKKTGDRPAETPDDRERPAAGMNWRWYWIRTALITVLMFLFILYLNDDRGASAYLWAGGLALATLGYFVVSYLRLRD